MLLADISLFHPFVLGPREDGLSLPPPVGVRLMLFLCLAGQDVGAKLLQAPVVQWVRWC